VIRAVVLLLALLWAPLALAVAVDVERLPDPAQEAQARALMKQLRCLVCQNQSIEDSNADMARDLRHLVREQVAAGKQPEEIKTYVVQRYGDWVLLRPPVEARTWLLWGTPAIALLGGAVLVALRLRRKPVETAPLSEEERRALRDLAGGPQA
jgi:cytochrome c-type biogenesis protein CcmH